MSGRLVGEVLDHAPEDLTAGQMVLLLALAEAAREHDRTARRGSSVADLARRTRMSPGTVRNRLGELVARGLIRPLFRARVGTAQAYELARLSQQHRHATVNGTRRHDSERHSPVTLNQDVRVTHQ